MGGPRGSFRLFAAALRTTLRGFGWTFAVLVLAAAGLAVYAYRRFGPDEVRLLAVGQLQALLRREVSIERLVLTPRGIKMKGLRVRSGRPGADADLLACDTALLTIKLSPLLRRRLELDAVRLDSPQISLTRGPEGDWDLADLLVSSAAARPRGGGLPVSLAAAEVIIEGGRLRLDDRRTGRRAVFERFALRFDGLGLDKPFPLSASFAHTLTVSSRSVNSVVTVEGSVDLAGLAWSSASARAERFSAQVDGAAFSGTLAVTDLRRPDIEASVSVSELGPEHWRRWTGRELELLLPPTRWSARVRLPEPGRVELERLSVQTPAGTLAATAVFALAGSSSSLSASLVARDVDLAKVGSWRRSWAARAPRGRASLRLELAGWPGRLQALSAELGLRGFGASWSGRVLEDLHLEASASEEFAQLRATVSGGSLRAYGARFEDLSGSARIAKQTLIVDGLGLRWGASRLRLRARVDRLSAPKEVLVSAQLDKLVWEDAHRLVSALVAAVSTRTTAPARPEARPWVRTFKYAIPRGFPDTAGHLRVSEVHQENFWCRDLDLLWSIKGVTPALNRVGGEARVRFGPGRVADIPAVQNAHRFLRVVFLPFIYMHKMNNLSVFSTATAYPKTLDFRRIESEYALARGVATTRYFHVDSGQLAAFAEGTADFGREQVDMNILTRLASTRAPLPEWWVDEAGRPAIGFRVKGDLNRPELEPRFKKIPVDEIERRLEDARASAKKRFEAVEKLRTL